MGERYDTDINPNRLDGSRLKHWVGVSEASHHCASHTFPMAEDVMARLTLVDVEIMLAVAGSMRLSAEAADPTFWTWVESFNV